MARLSYRKYFQDQMIPHYFNDGERVELKFERGDVIDFRGAFYYVFEVFGEHGVVAPIGEKILIKDFKWKVDDDVAVFIREFSDHEMRWLYDIYYMRTLGWKDLPASDYQ